MRLIGKLILPISFAYVAADFCGEISILTFSEKP